MQVRYVAHEGTDSSAFCVNNTAPVFIFGTVRFIVFTLYLIRFIPVYYVDNEGADSSAFYVNNNCFCCSYSTFNASDRTVCVTYTQQYVLSQAPSNIPGTEVFK